MHDNKKQPAIALIGCGAIAEKFYLPALTQHREILDRLILVDSNLARAGEMAKQFSVRRTAADYHEIMGEVQGAIVAVPHYLHFPISRDFLTAGVHVLCEKPLSEKASEVREMARLAEANGVTISVNNTRRLVPSNIAVKQMIESGELGTLKMITYLEGGEFDWPTASGFYFNSKLSQKGVLLDVGAHALDVLCQWLGSKPELVSSENDAFGGRDAVASVTLRHGECRAAVRLSWLSKLPNTFRVVGDKGMIEGPIYDWRSVTFTSADGRARKVSTEMGFADADAFLRKPVVNFIDILTNNASSLIPAQSVIPSIELIEEAYAAARRFPMPWYYGRENQ